ncbi:methyltransferase [Lentzea sp. JNUCC 0626]|uniref:methyltransferase n=1 Tax=Lentzea sp. JNUCC 0626 TaxID=3367513 RepID=UPI00374834FA
MTPEIRHSRTSQPELVPSPAEFVERAQRSDDPLQRFLARKRAELPRLVAGDGDSSSDRAARTWSEIRADRSLSRAFDEHMVSRATTANVFAPELFTLPAGRIVDVGGGPGHYLARALAVAGARWNGVLLETYDDAGWWCGTGHESGVDLLIVPAEPIAPPPPADVYLLGSILHDLADAEAAFLLRSCRESGRPGSSIVIIERAFDPAVLRHSARNLDMHVLFGGRERSRTEYLRMIESAGYSRPEVTTTHDAYQVFTACRGV